jgi:hypothetical protein
MCSAARRTYLRKVAVADFAGVTANTTFVLEPKDPSVLLPELLHFSGSAKSMLPRHITRIAQHQAAARASIPRPPMSALGADQRLARLSSALVRARPSAPATSSQPAARPPQIVWSEPSPRTQHREACNAAIAALLTDNSPEHQRQRDQYCGAEAGDSRVPDRAAAIRTAARVSARTRVLRSAAELTREPPEP